MAKSQNLINIVALIDGEHRGDDNNALGTQIAAEASFSNAGYTVSSQYANISEVEIPAAKMPTLYIGAGEHMIAPLAKLKQQKTSPPIYTSWSGHQYSDKLPTHEAWLDQIALPVHVVTDFNSGKLIRTIGVPHNTQDAHLDVEYDSWKDRILEKESPYTMVVLGGDAPTPNGTVQCYTKEEAFTFGQHIAKTLYLNPSHLIITNGPRTGKHDPETLESLNTHRENPALDPVTEAFIQGVESEGFIEKTLEDPGHYQLFDFRYGNPSAYKALLAAVRNNERSCAYIPGESTSMVSEACNLLSPNQVIICENNAMNEVHEAHIDSVIATGCANYLDKDFNLSSYTVNTEKKTLTAAETVTKALAARLIPQLQRTDYYWRNGVTSQNKSKPVISYN